jgi:Arc/MetJ-type ribon-helix-helix transcriptional regulator
MSQISLFLPLYLKHQVEALIDQGHYVSLSDLIRTAIRRLIDEDRARFIFYAFKREYRQGGAIVLENPQDVKAFLESVAHSDQRIHELFDKARKHIFKQRRVKF